MRYRTQAIGAVFACAVLLGSCNTDVVNPGRVEDTSLNERGGQTALVTGAGRALSFGMNWIAYTGAAVSREIHPAGSTGSFGINAKWQNGQLEPGDDDLDTHWNNAQRARWLAEEVIRRIDLAGPLNSGVLQQAHLWVGFSNRLLGDNMCEAVIDGGPAEPNTVYFTRAEAAFTAAIAAQAGTTLETAAYAGRAQVRVFLGKWAEAVADAGRVPTGFVYNLPYFNVGDDDQRNRIAWAVGGSPYRAHTQWNTWHAAYRDATNDPRVPYRVSARDSTGDAAVDCCGRVLWWPQTKHANSAAPIRLASGREMRLIEAENRLRNNDFPGAIILINQVRTAAGAPLVAATNATDTWTLLKRERGIELWLEARRLGDLRRWRDGNTPGALDPLEQPGGASHLARQDLCFPIPNSERDTNPNLRS